MENRKIYLIDFDGTITKEDTLTEIAKYFFQMSIKSGEKN